MVEFATLQNVFYVMSIVFMSVMFLMILALVVAVFVIRNKIVSLERNVQSKIDEATDLATKGGELLARVGSKAARAAADRVKQATRKTKR